MKFATTAVDLTSYVDTTRANPTDRLLNEMVELRIANERLKAQLEAMHQQMELVHELGELRAKNAVLEAKVEQYERRAAQAGTGNWIR